MTKLTLDLDALAVDSFETQRAEGAGTVLGNAVGAGVGSTREEVCVCSIGGCTLTG